MGFPAQGLVAFFHLLFPPLVPLVGMGSPSWLWWLWLRHTGELCGKLERDGHDGQRQLLQAEAGKETHHHGQICHSFKPRRCHPFTALVEAPTKAISGAEGREGVAPLRRDYTRFLAL